MTNGAHPYASRVAARSGPSAGRRLMSEKAGASDPELPRRIVALVLGISLLAVLPIIALATMPAPADLGQLLLRLLPLSYAAVRLTAIFLSSERRPFASVFFMFVYITLGVVPLAQYLLQREQYYAVGESPITTSLIVLVGCVAFDVGYWARNRTNTVRSPYTPQRGDASPSPELSVHAVASLRVLGVLGAIVASYYIFSAGGVSAFFSSRQDLGIATAESLSSDGGESTRAIVASLAKVAPLAVLLAYAHSWQWRRLKVRIPDVLIVALLAVVNVIVNNPISNPRYWFLAVMLGVFFTLVRSKTGQSVAVVSGILAAIVVFPVSDVTRYANPNDAVSYGSIWETIAVKDFDQFTMINNAVAYTTDAGFSLGGQIAGVLLFWVPRSAWPDKPLDTGVVLGEWLDMRNTNLSSPLWAEGWVNFGWVGVVVFLLLLGIAGRALDAHYARAFSGSGGVRIGSHVGTALLAGYLFIILRGPLLQASARLLVILVLIAVLNFVTRTREPSHAPPAPRTEGNT